MRLLSVEEAYLFIGFGVASQHVTLMLCSCLFFCCVFFFWLLWLVPGLWLVEVCHSLACLSNAVGRFLGEQGLLTERASDGERGEGEWAQTMTRPILQSITQHSTLYE